MVSWTHPEKAVSRLNSDALVTQLPSSSQDGMLYDTESAKKFFTDEASLEYIALGRTVQRVYFLTPNGNWFSAKEEVEAESGITDVGEYRIQVTKIIYTYSDLRMEQKYKVKDLIGRNDYELYKEYFGEVEEA